MLAFIAALFIGRLLMTPARRPARHAAPPRLGGRLGYMETRRTDINRVNDMLIKPTRATGFYEFDFQGTETTQELLVEVDFPCWFVDRPGFSFGSELQTDFLVDGEFPALSATVSSWKRMHEVRPGGGYWVGAFIAIVASSHEGERWIFHWQMDAKAMNIPGGTELDG